MLLNLILYSTPLKKLPYPISILLIYFFYSWCCDWQLLCYSFQYFKYQGLDLNNSHQNIFYHLSDFIIFKFQSVSDLRVRMNSKLSIEKHINKIVHKARNRCYEVIKHIPGCCYICLGRDKASSVSRTRHCLFCVCPHGVQVQRYTRALSSISIWER